jgi:hypothetical protein
VEDLIVEVQDPRHLTPTEHDAILDRCRRANMAIYISGLGDDPDKDIIRALGEQFGLRRLDHNAGADEDAITSLKVQTDDRHAGYIPYTTRPIAWHTDGYYNRPERQIHGLLLHCVHPAASGGDNDLLDHEIAYLALRDRNPDYVQRPHAPAGHDHSRQSGHGGGWAPGTARPRLLGAAGWAPAHALHGSEAQHCLAR